MYLSETNAHQLYTRALGDASGRWAAWHFTSLDNPFLSKPALDEITADMSEDAYRQEILAEFLDNEGADCRVEVARDRFNKVDYTFQRERLGILFALWNPHSILAEQNSIGMPLVEQLLKGCLLYQIVRWQTAL